MIAVEEALRRITAGLSPTPPQQVGLSMALGRVLATEVAARLTTPPKDVSAMDGYAVRAIDVADVPVTLKRIGEAPAGGAHEGSVGPGECVRIFTGGPLPEGTDAVVIQENVEADGEAVRVLESVAAGRYVRPAGLDFKAGDVGLTAGRRLTARDIGFAAAMNHPWLSVHRRPRIAILATGDEVVMPGDPIGENQIVSSNGPSLAALVSACGGEPILLGIAGDRADALTDMAAGARGAELLVTTGGASVGEHDLVQSALAKIGLKVDFWRIAMRPGKPLMFGDLDGVPMLGLPGNPVSTLVCGVVFMVPMIEAMLGLERRDEPARTARLGVDLAANDRRQDYLRATLAAEEDGDLRVTPFARQDSSMLSTLARADCLVLRPPNAPAAAAGERVVILPLPDRAGGF